MMSPSEPTSIGFENPKAWMQPAISAICASLCVRALRADGMSRATGHNSKRKRSTVDTASGLFILLLASFLASFCPFPSPPPSPSGRKKYLAYADLCACPKAGYWVKSHSDLNPPIPLRPFPRLSQPFQLSEDVGEPPAITFELSLGCRGLYRGIDCID